jgi:hypothetical protein
MNHVFISYRHSDVGHSGAVRALGDMLRRENIPVELDQFCRDANPGGPNEGWPRWSQDRARASACVLIVASRGWFAAYDGIDGEPGGFGAASEAAVFRQYLYDTKSQNERVRIVWLDDDASACAVPEPLRPWHQFRPFLSTEDRAQMLAWIQQRLQLDRPTAGVRWPEPVEFSPDIADRTHEWPLVASLLTGRSRERILLIEASAAGLGKSTLVRCAADYAKKLELPVAHVDFKYFGVDTGHVLGTFDLELGELLPQFRRDPTKLHVLRKDLRALRQPLLLIFDSYETAATNKALSDLVSGVILAEAVTAPAVAVIVAGQVVPDAAHAVWRDDSRRVCLEPITRVEHWEGWLARKFPSFREKKADINTILMATGGNPKVVAELFQAIEACSP